MLGAEFLVPTMQKSVPVFFSKFFIPSFYMVVYFIKTVPVYLGLTPLAMGQTPFFLF